MIIIYFLLVFYTTEDGARYFESIGKFTTQKECYITLKRAVEAVPEGADERFNFGCMQESIDVA